MKTKIFLLALFFIYGFNINAQSGFNPYESIGKEAIVLTLSEGKYEEFFDTDSIAIIGSAVLNIKTMKVIGFIVTDTAYSEATLEPEIVSRWLSVDPMAKKYPEESPYNFGLNNPIYYIDPDGGEVEPSDATKTVTPNALLGVIVHAAAKMYFDSKPGWKGEVTFSVPFLSTGRADLVYKDVNGKAAIWEIKPVSYRAPDKNSVAKSQLANYLNLAQISDPSSQYSIGSTNGTPTPIQGSLTIPITDGVYDYDATFFIPKGEESNGLIYYTLGNQRPSKVTEQVKEAAKNAAIGAAVVGIGAAAVATAPASGGSSVAVGAAAIGIILSPSTDNNQPNEQKEY